MTFDTSSVMTCFFRSSTEQAQTYARINELPELVDHGLGAQELSDRLTVAGLVETIEAQVT